MTKKITLSLFVLLSVFIAAIAAGPTVPSNNLQFPVNYIDGDRVTLNFNKGNGALRIVVMKEASPVSTFPLNGTDYTGNPAFATDGTAFNGTDGFVVFRGSHSQTSISLTVTKLKANTTYYVSIFEFNGINAATEYLLTALTGNVTTKAAPTGQATITSFTAVAGNRLTINWSAGNGEKRLILARKNSSVNAIPEELKDYPGFSQFGSGTPINGDNYVVYKGAGNSTTITNLEPNTVYHFTIFEFNGSSGPVYLTPGSSDSRLTNAGPTQASGTINFTNIEGNRLSLNFGIGNGKHQLIIGRKDQAVTAVPVNGQTYTASTIFE